MRARRSVLERGAEVTDHAELGEDDGAFGAAERKITGIR
jgi:hypothetical protein